MHDQSLLDRRISRLRVQRRALVWSRRKVGGRSGLVLEIGLGRGQTYDHLRRLFPARDIVAFDMGLRVPADLVPDADRLFLGDFRETLPAAFRRFGACARLAHADFGSADRRADAAQGVWLAPLIDALMIPGGLVLADRPLAHARWRPLAVPGAERWPYFAWRIGG